MKHVCIILFAFVAMADAQQAGRTPILPPTLRGIGIDQRLNTSIPLDTVFRDEQGASVSLRSYFHSRPVLLVPVYYTCPMLCSQILSGLVAGLRPLSLVPGRDFEIVAFSFNPSDTSADAARERNQYAHRYSPSAGTVGWHFLTGSPASIRALTEAIGFHYRYDPVSKIFVHASGVMVLTPEGKIARYFYGVEYEPKDLKLGLIEASNRTIGSPVDQILLFCYHYDPKTGKYGAVVMNLLRGAGVLTLLLMAVGLTVFWRFDLRRHRRRFQEASRL
jgi:protein SCO1